MITWLVTGGAGFIGSNFVKQTLASSENILIVNLDLLTYAGNLYSLDAAMDNINHVFIKGNIGDREIVHNVLNDFEPCAVINFAAETHVDRSIDSPDNFIRTNILGSYELIEAVRLYWSQLTKAQKSSFRFIHISTDEVYGSLGPTGLFSEETPYAPNSPYSASKAASDHLVRSYFKTYGLPCIITNCSNNYGPYQFPEKLIPLMILNALDGKPLPIYGDGKNIRDWLYVEDHCRAIMAVLENGCPGGRYNIGGNCEKTNLQVVHGICGLLDEMVPRKNSYKKQITYVQDRPGHDLRYAIDAGKIKSELGWEPQETFETGLRKTVEWYIENREWCRRVLDGSYRGERLGLGGTA